MKRQRNFAAASRCNPSRDESLDCETRSHSAYVFVCWNAGRPACWSVTGTYKSTYAIWVHAYMARMILRMITRSCLSYIHSVYGIRWINAHIPSVMSLKLRLKSKILRNTLDYPSTMWMWFSSEFGGTQPAKKNAFLSLSVVVVNATATEAKCSTISRKKWCRCACTHIIYILSSNCNTVRLKDVDMLIVLRALHTTQTHSPLAVNWIKRRQTAPAEANMMVPRFINHIQFHHELYIASALSWL